MEHNYTTPDLSLIDKVRQNDDFIQFFTKQSIVASICLRKDSGLEPQKMIQTSIGWRYSSKEDDNILRDKYKELING